MLFLKHSISHPGSVTATVWVDPWGKTPYLWNCLSWPVLRETLPPFFLYLLEMAKNYFWSQCYIMCINWGVCERHMWGQVLGCLRGLVPVCQVSRLVSSVAAHPAPWLQLHHTCLKLGLVGSWPREKQWGKTAAVLPRVWQTGHVSSWPWRILRCWRYQTWGGLWFLTDGYFSC